MEADKRCEATIRGGDDALLADDIGKSLEPFRDQLWMLELVLVSITPTMSALSTGNLVEVREALASAVKDNDKASDVVGRIRALLQKDANTDRQRKRKRGFA